MIFSFHFCSFNSFNFDQSIDIVEWFSEQNNDENTVTAAEKSGGPSNPSENMAQNEKVALQKRE